MGGAALVVVIVTYAVTVPLVMRGMKAVEEADAWGVGVAGEGFGMVRMVMAMGGEEGVVARYARWVDQSRSRGVGIAKFVAIQQGIGEFFPPE